MAFTAALFCISALLQTISGRCIENPIPNMGGCGGSMAGNAWVGNNIGLAGNGYGAGYSYGNTGYSGLGFGNALESVDTYGGSLLVTSSSPLAPSGLSVVSENNLEGALSVAGKLPFLGAVALEGTLPAGGTAQAAYGCGSGDVRILETYGTGMGYGAGSSGFGLASGASAGIDLGAGVEYGGGAIGVGYGTGAAGRGYGAGAAGLGYSAGFAPDNRACGCSRMY